MCWTTGRKRQVSISLQLKDKYILFQKVIWINQYYSTQKNISWDNTDFSIFGIFNRNKTIWELSSNVCEKVNNRLHNCASCSAIWQSLPLWELTTTSSCWSNMKMKCWCMISFSKNWFTDCLWLNLSALSYITSRQPCCLQF